MRTPARTRPDMPRSYVTPFYPVFPAFAMGAAIICLIAMTYYNFTVAVIFVAIMLLVGAHTFSTDADKLVLEPICTKVEEQGLREIGVAETRTFRRLSSTSALLHLAMMGLLLLVTVPFIIIGHWQVVIMVQLQWGSSTCAVAVAGMGVALASTTLFERAAPVVVLWPIAAAPLVVSAFWKLYSVSRVICKVI